MKKKTLLKSLGLMATSVVAVTPIALTVSCANGNGIQTCFISWKQIIDDDNLNNYKAGSFKYDDILMGSRKFFDGNYILFVGSNMYNKTCRFFSDSESNRKTQLWLTDSFANSYFRNDIFMVNRADKDYIDFGFVTFIDSFDNQVYDKSGHKLVVTKDANKGYWATWPIKPFDKWDEGSIQQTKKFMLDTFDYKWNDDEDNPEVKAGDYIRQDEQAKQFRDFVTRGAALFPTSDTRKQGFDTGDNNETSLMVIYKGGKLREIVVLPSQACVDSKKNDKDTNSLTGSINKYFIEGEPDPEPPKPPEPDPKPDPDPEPDPKPTI